eukprot:TRINITY_DN5954_c0_g1_i1.p1 TRINITY_DN5954_c0_g1~~TRINITY_DN5954_c0_g1_i1.p1  ORF type:complete len:615 (-),score=121.36 TRINITY_DN5954_c0_g1_i1:104-1948(-)
MAEGSSVKEANVDDIECIVPGLRKKGTASAAAGSTRVSPNTFTIVFAHRTLMLELTEGSADDCKRWMRMFEFLFNNRHYFPLWYPVGPNTFPADAPDNSAKPAPAATATSGAPAPAGESAPGATAPAPAASSPLSFFQPKKTKSKKPIAVAASAPRRDKLVRAVVHQKQQEQVVQTRGGSVNVLFKPEAASGGSPVNPAAAARPGGGHGAQLASAVALEEREHNVGHVRMLEDPSQAAPRPPSFHPQVPAPSRKVDKRKSRMHLPTSLLTAAPPKTPPASTNACWECNQALGHEFSRMGDEKYHRGCLVCAMCKKPFSGESYFNFQGRFFCRKDYMDFVADRCTVCDEPLEGEYKQITLDGVLVSFHDTCFLCSMCQQPFPGGAFVEFRGMRLCQKDFESNFGRVCLACGNVIAVGAEMVSLPERGHHIHRDCFSCHGCRKSLIRSSLSPAATGQQQVTVDAYVVVPKSADGTTQKESEIWHSACFSCDMCATNLASSGFLSSVHPPPGVSSRKFGDRSIYYYCRKDYDQVFSRPCPECHKTVQTGEQVFELQEEVYHSSCLKCTRCSTSIRSTPEGTGFPVFESKQVFCRTCFVAHLDSLQPALAELADLFEL